MDNSEPTFFLNYWVLQVLAMVLTVALIPRLRFSGISGAFLAVGGIALVNTFLWDAALFFSLPDSLTLHAALLLVVNGMIFWLLVKILPGVEIEGVLPAIAAPVVLSVSSFLIREYGGDINWVELARMSGEWLFAAFHSLREYFGTK